MIAVVVAFGCARSAPDAEPTAAPAADEPAEPAEDDPSDVDDLDDAEDEKDVAAPTSEAPPADASAEHISFDGPDADAGGPTDQVVAPPPRPTMPSMMTDVLKTGPRSRPH